MLGLVEDAREAGLDVTFDGYPYAYSSTRLNIVIPQWAFDGGLAALRRNLADPDGARPDEEGDGRRGRRRGTTCG